MSNLKDRKIVVQGFPGCFHEEAARKYFNTDTLQIIPSTTFEILAKTLVSNPKDHLAIIAIENSIAGTILQNYRILRENQFRVVGEVYLRIRHNIMALTGQQLSDIKEVHSHPMALNQCLEFLSKYPDIRLVESDDTALSAKNIRDNKLENIAAIASETAAKIYDLDILGKGIETSNVNYTRFFLVQDGIQVLPEGDFNKASIYMRVSHEKGSLMRALECLYNNDINLTKLQSFPVLGKINEYYFHIDLEFDDFKKYQKMIQEMQAATMMVEVLGVYKKANVYDHQTIG